MSYDIALALMETVVLNEDDIFKPYSKLEYLEKLGAKINPDGTMTYGKYTFDPNAKGYVIFTDEVEEESRIYRVATHLKLPGVGAFGRIAKELRAIGVKWVQCSTLLSISYKEEGLQIVGTYAPKRNIGDQAPWTIIVQTALDWSAVHKRPGFYFWIGVGVPRGLGDHSFCRGGAKTSSVIQSRLRWL